MVTPNDVRLTDADIKNSWTAETLAEHIAQTQAAEHTALMARLFPDKRRGDRELRRLRPAYLLKEQTLG